MERESNAGGSVEMREGVSRSFARRKSVGILLQHSRSRTWLCSATNMVKLHHLNSPLRSAACQSEAAKK